MSKLNHSPHCFHESQDLQGVRREVLTLTNDILCLLKVRDRREAAVLPVPWALQVPSYLP